MSMKKIFNKIETIFSSISGAAVLASIKNIALNEYKLDTCNILIAVFSIISWLFFTFVISILSKKVFIAYEISDEEGSGFIKSLILYNIPTIVLITFCICVIVIFMQN